MKNNLFVMFALFLIQAKERPVYIEGHTDAKIRNGHMWVIDGYLNRDIINEQIVKYLFIESFDNSISTRSWYQDVPTFTSTCYRLVHCNWGWNGNGNGYYNSQVFDTNYEMVPDGDLYFKTQESSSSRHYYNKNIEIIADIKPGQN